MIKRKILQSKERETPIINVLSFMYIINGCVSTLIFFRTSLNYPVGNRCCLLSLDTLIRRRVLGFLFFSFFVFFFFSNLINMLLIDWSNARLHTRSVYGHSVNLNIMGQHSMKCEWGADAN
jgi:hypothetical protein